MNPTGKTPDTAAGHAGVGRTSCRLCADAVFSSRRNSGFIARISAGVGGPSTCAVRTQHSIATAQEGRHAPTCPPDQDQLTHACTPTHNTPKETELGWASRPYPHNFLHLVGRFGPAKDGSVHEELRHHTAARPYIWAPDAERASNSAPRSGEEPRGERGGVGRQRERTNRVAIKGNAEAKLGRAVIAGADVADVRLVLLQGLGAAGASKGMRPTEVAKRVPLLASPHTSQSRRVSGCPRRR
jgi:hypothetical protein